MGAWDSLSIREKADMMKAAIRNGITTLPEIKQAYNEFAEGGNIYDGTKPHSSQMQKKYIYDVLPGLFAQDGVKISVTSGYRPGAVVRGTNKPSRHGLKQAADIVGDFDAIRRVLDDPNSNTSKWLLANGYGYLDETSKTGTSKFWHDKKRDHSHYHIGTDKGIVASYAKKMQKLLSELPQQQETVSMLPTAVTVPEFIPYNPQVFFGQQVATMQMPIESVDVPQEETATNQEPTEENNNFGTFNTIMELLNAATPQESVPVMAQAQAKASSPYIVNRFDKGGSKKSGGSFYQTHRARWFNFLRKKGVDPIKAERLATYFSAQDSLESGHGTSDAARRKNNYGGIQRLDKKTNKMVNVSYGSIDDYMNAKWKMMNSKYSRALNAKSVQEYANILNDPKYHGKAYMYGLYKGYRDGQPLDVARQTKYMNDYTRIMMDIAGEKGFKGADVPDDLSIVQPENPYTQFIPFEPFNPQVFNSPQAFVTPTREQFEAEQPIVEAAKDYAYSPEQLEKEERRQGLNNLSFILGMMNGGNGNSFADTIGMLTGNIAAKGGPIHIKPENRGKFTALKERTGHSATWFKEHGTPAQKKMATFALNAAKWKHGYGGNLYGGGGGTIGMPAMPALSLRNAVAKRLYETTDAYDSYNVGNYLTKFATGKTEDGLEGMREHLKYKLKSDSSDNEVTRRWKGELNQVDIADELYAQYLGIPVKERHTNVRLQKSPYRDAYKMPITNAEWDTIIRETDNLDVGKNTSTGVFMKAGLNESTIGKGHDKKGEYRSYGDSFDLNPFRGSFAVADVPIINKIDDLSLGMFNPVEVYDRIYLDDYYKVPKEYRGGNFLPEIEVIGKKRRGKKHGYGGHIYNGTSEDTQQMNTPRYRKLLDAEIKEELSDNDVMELPLAAELSDVRVTGKKKRNVLSQIEEKWVKNDKGEEVPTYWGYNPDTKQLEQLYRLEDGKSADESVFFTPDGGWSYNVPQAAEMRKAHEQWVKNGGNASDFDKWMLGYLGFGLTPIALPEIAAGALTPTGQTLLAGTLGGEAWEALNHGITGQSWGDNLGDVIGLDKDNYLGRTALGLTNPFYGLSPSMIYKGGEAVLGAGKTALNLAQNTASKSVEALQNKYPALFDPYTSWDATLGYHGDNIFSRAVGTIGRRHGYTPKAEIPEFHRRLLINEPETFRMTDDGKFIMSSGRTGDGHDNIVNFATSEPARGHNSHRSLSGINDFIIPSKVLKGVEFKSIQPSDTFFEVPELSVNPKQVTLVSGDPETLKYARSLGMRTLSSPRLRHFNSLNQEGVRISGRVPESKAGRFNFDKGAEYENAEEIGKEIQRLTSMRGAPTMQDYTLFESQTGLNSGVIPNTSYNLNNRIDLLGRYGSVRSTPIFNNVIYDPATNLEAIYRKAKIGKGPWSDYYEALEKMPSAREQLGQ